MRSATDGRADPVEAPRDLEVRSPGDGSLVGRVPIFGTVEVEDRVRRCREVQTGWASLELADRLRRLKALHRRIAGGADRIADGIRLETGKPEVEALGEVLVSLDLLRFYLGESQAVLEPRSVRTGWLPGRKAWVEREPYGVIGVISPWNYPFILAMDAVVTALVCGNGVVLKPSEHTPFTGRTVAELVVECGLPEGLVCAATGGAGTGEALVRAGVDKLFFTGSVETGRKVMAAAAERPTPVVLELGGKDPALVLDDADLERAAAGVVFGAMYNAGQTCTSTERVFAVDSVYDRLVDLIVERTAALRADSSGKGDLGPMITEEQLKIVESHVEEAVEGGARALVGGARTDPASNVFEPTVLVDVEPSMRVMTEETFGPVLPICRVRDEDEAVERANALDFGLFASVWTGDRERGVRVARRLRAGGVSVNDTLTHYAIPGLPIGGTGSSGFGRTRGREGLREMSRPRSLLVNRRSAGRDPHWFPYGGSGSRVARALLRFRRKGGLRGVVDGLAALLTGGTGESGGEGRPG